jgi:uncharacterized protein DUF4235
MTNPVMKALFAPIRILAGVLAGLVGRKLFERLWRLVDREDPPSPEHREVSWAKLIAALLLEGAIFRLVKGLADRGARRAFAVGTGSWPGEGRPPAEE